MLRAAGVDRIALPERARTLDAPTRARLHDEWRAQRELAVALLADAQRACAWLPARERLVADIDDEIARSFPVPPASAGSLRWPERERGLDDAAALELMRTTHPMWGARAVATVALAWRGDLRRELVAELQAYACADTTLAVVAAAALCAWRGRRAGAAPRRLGEELERALRRGLAHAELAPWCAVALALARVGDEQTAALRAIGDDAPAELRLGAALALGDEPRLARFVDDADAERRDTARTALAERGAMLVASLLAGDDERPLSPDGERRALLRRLPHPLPSSLVAAVMACVEQGGAELAHDALRMIERVPFRERTPTERTALGALATRVAARRGVERMLELLAWAGVEGGGAQELAPFVAAARTALLGTSARERVEARALDAFLRLAHDEDLAPLDEALLDHELGARLLGRVLDLWARRDHHDVDAVWLEARMGRWWSARPTSVEAWSGALSARSGMSGRDEVVAFFWRRFCARADERVAIAAALRPWSQLLHEARAAAPAHDRPGGDDVVAQWEVWSAAEPHDMWRLVDELNPTVPAARLATFAERVFDAAEAVVGARPRTGIVTVFRVCAEIANRVRQHEASEELDAAAAVIERRMPSFGERFAAARAADEGERGAEHFLDDIATERRLIAEVYERRHERAAREQQRLEQQRQLHERLEQQRLEQARRDEAASIAVRASPSPERSALVLPEPDFPRGGIDDEPFIAGPGPRSVVEYAQLLKALQRGNDALAVFAAWELDAASWAACANRWAALMCARPDVAMRFAALLSERWR